MKTAFAAYAEAVQAIKKVPFLMGRPIA